MEQHAAAGPGIDREVEAVPVLDLLPDVIGKRHQVADLTEARAVEIEQRADRLTTAAGQTGVARSDDAERAVVGRGDERVVGHREVAVDATEVADIDADAGEQLVLDAGRELPVVTALAPADEDVRIVGGARDRLAEAQV